MTSLGHWLDRPSPDSVVTENVRGSPWSIFKVLPPRWARVACKQASFPEISSNGLTRRRNDWLQNLSGLNWAKLRLFAKSLWNASEQSHSNNHQGRVLVVKLTLMVWAWRLCDVFWGKLVVLWSDLWIRMPWEWVLWLRWRSDELMTSTRLTQCRVIDQELTRIHRKTQKWG